MKASRHGRLILLLLTAIAAGCADGGRGSSGFDISENVAIMRVLETQECLSGDRLTLCPADQMATPTAATPTSPPGPTSTPTPNVDPRIETGLEADDTAECTRPEIGAPCTASLAFNALSFPAGAVFRVASRLPVSGSEWSLAPPPVLDATIPGGFAFDADVPLGGDVDASGARVQFAVIVFLAAPEAIPPMFDELADSGADLAFVTPELLLDVVTQELSPTPTLTPPASNTPSQPAASQTPTPTETPPTPSLPVESGTPTPTPTATTRPDGPEITYFGVAQATGRVLEPIGFDDEERPIFFSLTGRAMSLIVEAEPGDGRPAPGRNGYDPDGPPDLQIITSQALGDGSQAVCDITEPNIGGVPATQPFAFANTPAATAALNDFGCRVDDGTGQPLARVSRLDACTISEPGGTGFDFVNEVSRLQFCLPIARAWAFPRGDTIVAARVRDIFGGIGPVKEIVIRVGGSPVPTFPCEGAERMLTIARPASMLLSSYSGAVDAGADPWSEGPLRLCIGSQDLLGRRSVRLRNDVRLALGVADGSVLCVHLEANGSSGVIDCDGGSAHDVQATVETGDGPGFNFGLATNNGGDAGPGAATLFATVGMTWLRPGSAPSGCESVADRERLSTALTTATATARIRDLVGGGTTSIAARGTNFDCARLTQTDSPGALALPFPAVDTIVGDTANVVILAD